MNVTRFLPAHLALIDLQAEQAPIRDEILKPEYGAALALCSESVTLWDGGEPVACFGAYEIHPQRAELWALLTGRCMKSVTRLALGWLQQTEYRRVEFVVATDFEAGHKWASILGFEQEGGERVGYMPDGRSAITYVRLRDGIHCPVHSLHRGRDRRGGSRPSGQHPSQREADGSADRRAAGRNGHDAGDRA